ncbi:methyltransferase domain-containing protein [Brevibacterium album]|uniref:methyltransferase domain-containing protein n=1 Tax=Brevibacterium album TaxID=417948 RepID=UPI00041AB937|nr:methyltransferase domain-containing protein [Brevibacterium album]
MTASPAPAPQRALLACAHYAAGECRSCTLLPVPTEDRLVRAQEELAQLLDPFAEGPSSPWLPPVRSPLAGFRNKAKMVVSGTVEAPVLGILDGDGAGVDLSDCPLYPAPVHAVLTALPALIRRAQVPPYSVARRRGELKHVLVTASEAGELMVRFVLRSAAPVERLREHIGLLTEAVAGVRVVTANLQPEPAALLEGPEEIPVWGEEALTVRQGRVPLRVRPQSFLQTNTAVASQLYEQVAQWADAAEAGFREQGHEAALREERTGTADPADGRGRPYVVWDLFCGVGGFALHCALPSARPPADGEHGGAGQRGRRRVIGVEVSEQAIGSARATAAELGLDAEFHAADAGLFAADGESTLPRPDLLIVNPPRRGLGRDLAAWVESSGIPDVVYSSCNPRTLARDLADMPSYRITGARVLDMFPHTAHTEVVVRLRRAGV